MEQLWEEFTVSGLCGLCGNTGMVDTKSVSPAGFPCGINAPCICPNGRAIKRHREKDMVVEPSKKTPAGLQRFWASWNETGQDYRPMTSPPNPAILGWWCSGEAGDGSYSTMCAWVEAKDEDAAMTAVKQDWPPARKMDWRFFEERAPDWTPGDRFPLSDWSKERIKA